jgi:hypothetical protein
MGNQRVDDLSWVGRLESSMRRTVPLRDALPARRRRGRCVLAAHPTPLFSPNEVATSKLCLDGWWVLATNLIVYQVGRARLPRRSLATARAASLAGRAGAPSHSPPPRTRPRDGENAPEGGAAARRGGWQGGVVGAARGGKMNKGTDQNGVKTA